MSIMRHFVFRPLPIGFAVVFIGSLIVLNDEYSKLSVAVRVPMVILFFGVLVALSRPKGAAAQAEAGKGEEHPASSLGRRYWLMTVISLSAAVLLLGVLALFSPAVRGLLPVSVQQGIERLFQ